VSKRSKRKRRRAKKRQKMPRSDDRRRERTCEERELDEQDERVKAILGDREDLDREEALKVYCEHLKNSLRLPCEVTGMEDFRWEERYVFGFGDRGEYEELKKTRPSYRDTYDLLAVDRKWHTDWMIFSEDIGAHVRRQSDGREFTLGLAELEATNRESENHQLIEDYASWFVNSR
jgi:hypothetical protein